ncbi:MAG: hypothetical protein HYR76_07085 [Ignavibacteria bacterium]|nr:hypothetical protein [Ignavibacteria bacterium]MBI3766329.1 hypothetical protein [Ignavibacteriales bacterium]
MKLLRDDSENLAKDDYVALRPFIKLLDMTIHDYKELKVSLFNFRRFLEYLRNFKITNHSFEQIKWDDNPKLSGLRKDYGYALVSAFFSYTPLIRSEIILKFVLFTLKMFGKETYSTMLETIDAMTKEFDFPLSVMARIRS